MRYIFIFFICSNIVSQDNPISNADEFQRNLKIAESYLFKHRDSTYKYLHRALNFAEKDNVLKNKLLVFEYLLYGNGYYYDLEGYRTNLDVFDSLITNNKDKAGLNLPYYRVQLLMNKGNFYYLSKNYSKSEESFMKLTKALEKNKANNMDATFLDTRATAFNYLGSINKNLRKFDIAEHYYEKEINIYLEHQDIILFWKKSLYNAKKLLSSVFKEQKQYGKAISQLKDCIDYYEDNYKGNYQNALVTSYFELAESYLAQNMAQQAMKTINTATKYLSAKEQFIRRQLMIKADIHTISKRFVLAEATYDSVLQKTIAYRNSKRHQDVAEVFIKLGDLEKKRGLLKKSLDYYQRALVSASKNFDDMDIIRNPAPIEVFSKTQLLTILKKKLAALNLFFEFESDNVLQWTSFTSRNLIETLDALRPEFESKLDKQFLIEQTYPAFHQMILTAYRGYNMTKQRKYLDDAFLYMEKSKGILLLEAVKSSEAVAFGVVPDSILDKERQYRAYITNAEKKLIDATDKSKAVLNDSLFRLNIDYYDFLSDIEKKYPKYYQLKYDTKTTTLKELQEFLETDETVLSFHQTEAELFAFVTTKSDIKFLKIPFTPTIKKNITQFYKLLSNPAEGAVSEIKKLSESIYDQVLAPCIKNNSRGNLTIIADGLLSYIPFDALVDSKTKDYLIKTKNIRYANSATLLTANKAKVKNDGESSLLTISPTFNSDSGFTPLPFSKQEARLISSYFKGKTLSGKEASIENFMAIKGEYSLLHFATHALANDEDPDFSYLAFTAEKNRPNRLYVKDLYNYSLNADMVTLSACESGIGKLQKGEGMLSLARGFQYAGVNSLTTTLWKNDDQVTSELMGLFYKHLKSGLTKSKALQKAKLDYLNATEEEELKHPYYWAGFVVLGDNSPISEQPVSPWWFAGLIFLGTGFLVFGYKKIKAHQAVA